MRFDAVCPLEVLMMKILMISQYYYPEPFRHPDICEELVKRGHEVTAVVGVPNYPMGKVYPGFRFGKNRDEVINGVKVHRCFTIGRRKNLLFRVLNYYSYDLAARRYVSRLKDDFDVIFVNQLSPVMMAEPAIQYKKKHGTPIVLYCLDLWPESVIAGMISRGSYVYRYFHWVSRTIYHQVDQILATSRSFADYFSYQFGIRDIPYLPQYAESIFTPEQCRKPQDAYVDLMFAGNVGTAQCVDTIIRAAELTKDIPNLRWHIVGDGVELGRMQKLAAKLPNVIFYGRKPLEEMPKYYAMADAMLVTLKTDPVLSLTLPGKMQTYMAAGKPVLGAIDGETPLVVQEARCGICGPAENAEILAENARKLMNADREAMGANAHAYYMAHFRKSRFMDELEAILQKYAAR